MYLCFQTSYPPQNKFKRTNFDSENMLFDTTVISRLHERSCPFLIISQRYTKVFKRVRSIYPLTYSILSIHPGMESAYNFVDFLDLPEDLLPNGYLPQEPGAMFPRLVDTEKFTATVKLPNQIYKYGPYVPDMIVTLLYKYDEKVLKAFLDPGFENIAFYCKQESPQDDDFFIRKIGSSIMESLIHDLGATPILT